VTLTFDLDFKFALSVIRVHGHVFALNLKSNLKGLRLTVNQRHGTDGQTVGRGAMLYAAS